jgi:hypothetical protein
MGRGSKAPESYSIGAFRNARRATRKSEEIAGFLYMWTRWVESTSFRERENEKAISGGFGTRTMAPRPYVAGTPEGPGLGQRSHNKREGALH